MTKAQTRIISRRNQELGFTGAFAMKNILIFTPLFLLIALFCMPHIYNGNVILTPTDAQALLDGDSSPNWISTSTTRKAHRVAKWQATEDTSVLYLKAMLEKMPRTTIVTITENYIHAEYRSPLLGYYNDLEILWEPVDNAVAFKSSARIGYTDMGMGKRYYNTITKMLVDEKLITVIQ